MPVGIQNYYQSNLFYFKNLIIKKICFALQNWRSRKLLGLQALEPYLMRWLYPRGLIDPTSLLHPGETHQLLKQ